MRMLSINEQSNAGAEEDGRPANNLLQRLEPADYRAIAPYLKEAVAEARYLIYDPGQNVEMVHFPCGPSLVSYLVASEDGRDVETVLVGREGAVGGIVSLGYLPAYCRIVVKFGGPFVRLPVSALEAAKAESHALRHLFARYADCLLAQIFQSTACNAIHSIEQRAAKWILAAADRTGATTVPMTHEELSQMLGVGRGYTSRVLNGFRSAELIQSRRGALEVKSVEGLKRRACKCNQSVTDHFHEVLSGVYPKTQLSQ